MQLVPFLISLVVLYFGLKWALKGYSLDDFNFFSKKQEPTKLKKAFENARAEKDITRALLEFWNAELYVIVEKIESDDRIFFLFTSSPNKERWCITVSEKEEWLNSGRYMKQKSEGNRLIRALEHGDEEIEIVILYGDGGDYITKEHLKSLRSLIKEAGV